MMIAVPGFGILQAWMIEENKVKRIPPAIGNGMHVTINSAKDNWECNIQERYNICWIN